MNNKNLILTKYNLNKKDINNLNDWWYSNEVQHARKIFCDQFANLTNENYKKYIKFYNEI